MADVIVKKQILIFAVWAPNKIWLHIYVLIRSYRLVRANRWKATVLSSLEVVCFRGAVTSSVRLTLRYVMLRYVILLLPEGVCFLLEKLGPNLWIVATAIVLDIILWPNRELWAWESGVCSCFRYRALLWRLCMGCHFPVYSGSIVRFYCYYGDYWFLAQVISLALHKFGVLQGSI